MAFHIGGISAESVFLRLDPGEAGFQGQKLPASQAPRAVAAQELGNKLQFIREAMVKGLDVDLATVSLSLSAKGAIAGQTQVQFSDKPGVPEQLAQTTPDFPADIGIPARLPEKLSHINGFSLLPEERIGIEALDQAAKSADRILEMLRQQNGLFSKGGQEQPTPLVSFLLTGLFVNAQA